MQSNYMVVHSKDLHALCAAVQAHMQNGYIPAGGIAVLATLQETIYMQAVFKLEVPAFNHLKQLQ